MPTGYLLVDQFDTLATPPWRPAWMDAPMPDPTGNPREIFDSSVSVLSGPQTNTQPVDENPTSNAGDYLGGFVDHLYNKIHINPPALDMGNLVSNQLRTVELWNAFFTSVNLSSFVGTNTEGIRGGADIPARRYLPIGFHRVRF